jgi:hypothetical protein
MVLENYTPNKKTKLNLDDVDIENLIPHEVKTCKNEKLARRYLMLKNIENTVDTEINPDI